jgi:uncharacterized cupin superfamily protein
MKLRRVVTGFDASGKAVVSSDEVVPELDIPGGMKISALWAYEDKVGFATPNRLAQGYGPDFHGDDTRLNWGVSDLAPGQVLPMHGTQTVDLITVLEGEVTCVLDSGVVITLRPHDVMLQRGPVHQWENRGTTRCVWSFAALGRLDG